MTARAASSTEGSLHLRACWGVSQSLIYGNSGVLAKPGSVMHRDKNVRKKWHRAFVYELILPCNNKWQDDKGLY